MNFEMKSFEELSTRELYEVYKLRTAIFVVEQECAYQEVDKHDLITHHLMYWENEELVGYCRILPPETVYQQPSIGRVAIDASKRGSGLGRKLFELALTETQKLYPKHEIKIQAQCYLEPFYKSLGFTTISEPYPDVGIMHIDMIKR